MLNVCYFPGHFDPISMFSGCLQTLIYFLMLASKLLMPGVFGGKSMLVDSGDRELGGWKTT